MIGYPSANRLIPEVEHLIGFFVNVIPLRSFITEDKTFDTFLIETRDNLIQGYSNQNVHFDELVSKLGVNREANIHPVFQTLFTLHTSYEDVGFAGLESTSITGYDLRWEQYLDSGSNYSFGLFYKDLTKPIEAVELKGRD